jgi:hypothetical protein
MGRQDGTKTQNTVHTQCWVQTAAFDSSGTGKSLLLPSMRKVLVLWENSEFTYFFFFFLWKWDILRVGFYRSGHGLPDLPWGSLNHICKTAGQKVSVSEKLLLCSVRGSLIWAGIQLS